MTLTDLTLDSVLATFGRRARRHGHPVTCVLPGRQPMPAGPDLDWTLPNDRLDIAAEIARDGVEWAMVVLPDDADVYRLMDVLCPPRPARIVATGWWANPLRRSLTQLLDEAVVAPYALHGTGVLNVPLPILDAAFPAQEVA